MPELGGCIREQQEAKSSSMSGPPLFIILPVVWQESPGTTLKMHGSLAFGHGKPEQCMDQPDSQAANEGARHLAQWERRKPLPGAYSVLSKVILLKGSATQHSVWPERYTCTHAGNIWHHVMERAWGFGVRHRFESSQCYLLAVWPWENAFIFLSLCCLTC